MSADGRFVAFATFARDLVPGDIDTDANWDVYVRDVVTETTEIVSVNPEGTQSGDAYSGYPVISGDGRFVAFETAARNLVPNDTDSGWDVSGCAIRLWKYDFGQRQRRGQREWKWRVHVSVHHCPW